MEKSESIKELCAALCKFQQDVPHINLDREVEVKTANGKYTFKYATLGNIIDTCKPILVANGLSFTQLVEPDGSVTTMLMHTSGEYLMSNLRISGQATAQGIGSSITYAKRYALSAILGIVADDDDDANIADGNTYTVEKDNNKEWLNPNTDKWTEAVKYLQTEGSTIDKIKSKYRISKTNEEKLKAESL